MKPERMKEIEDRLDEGIYVSTDTEDLFMEVGAYQHLILQLLTNLKDLSAYDLRQKVFLLETIKRKLTVVQRAHDLEVEENVQETRRT